MSERRVGEHDVPCGHDRPVHGWQPAGCVKPRGHDTHWNGQGDTWRTDDEAYLAAVAAAEARGRQQMIDALRDRRRYEAWLEQDTTFWGHTASVRERHAAYLDSIAKEGSRDGD